MPDRSFDIRRGCEADIATLQALERDAAESFLAIGYDFCTDDDVVSEEDHKRVLAAGAVFIAECDGAPAGFILLWPMDGYAHIAEVSVAQSFQKRGLGRVLIDAGESWARAAGFKTMSLTTFRDVPWNAPFYASLGYHAFTPGADEPEISAIRAEEIAAGLSDKPRVAMKKRL